MKRIHISSVTLSRQRGFYTDIQGFTHIGLARSVDEARGQGIKAAQRAFPGYAIQGEVITNAVLDDIVREAARELGVCAT